MHIGGKIRELIKKRGVTIKYLSERTGKSSQLLNHYLKNENIDTGTLIQIATVLGVPITYFFEEGIDILEIDSDELEKLENDIQLNALKGYGLVFLRYEAENYQFITYYKKLENPLGIDELNDYETWVYENIENTVAQNRKILMPYKISKKGKTGKK